MTDSCRPCAEFFQEVAAIQKRLDELDRSLEGIYTLHEKSKTYTRSDKVKQAREQMRDDVLQVSKVSEELTDSGARTSIATSNGYKLSPLECFATD